MTERGARVRGLGFRTARGLRCHIGTYRAKERRASAGLRLMFSRAYICMLCMEQLALAFDISVTRALLRA